MTTEPTASRTTEVDAPRCPRCSSPTHLERIEPDKPQHDRRIFRCSACGEAVSETVKYR
jgi:DNA-directed RNA polymerase subunit RPC12/RpoP